MATVSKDNNREMSGIQRVYGRIQRSFVEAAMLSLTVRVVQFLIEVFLKIVFDIEQGGKKCDSKNTEAFPVKENDRSAVSLFPEISASNMYVEEYDESSRCPTPCSTGLATRLLPFKNEKGEIEWTFTDEVGFEHGPSANEKDRKDQTPSDSSPSSTASISRESKYSSESPEVIKKQERDDMSSTARSTPEGLVDTEGDDEGNIKENESYDEKKSFPCPHCDAVFRIRGYLTRHLKKHDTKKAYTCPFHKSSIITDENNVIHKCHPTGGFSRRDTYKTHLKSRHFKYPKGTRTKDRSSSSGSCGMCGEFFQNAEIWCEIHIEGAECRCLPSGFKGKSIIKNRLRRQLSKNKGKDIDLSSLEASKLLESSFGLGNTPNSSSNQVSYSSHSSNSPTFSISSSINGNVQGIQNITLHSQSQICDSPVYYHQIPTPQSQQINPYQRQDNHVMDPATELHESFPKKYNEVQMNMYDEYDDDYCLDIDQLNKSSIYLYNEFLAYANPS